MTRPLISVFSLVFSSVFPVFGNDSQSQWISIFNGKDLTGWVVNTENPNSVKVKDGMLVIDGPRTHAFYQGENHNFSDFEFRCKVMTKPGANSGIYFHTKYQENGWPKAGYECQVNNSHSDPRKTGSLYAVKDNLKSPVQDNEWFDYYIKVVGKTVTIKINGKTIIEYTEPEKPDHLKTMPGRLMGSGTIGIQAHDPKSVAFYKDLELNILD